jgi:hypothetical protein
MTGTSLRMVSVCRARGPDADSCIVYDESYLRDNGTAPCEPGTGSELWIIDASTMYAGMQAVVCRIKLPQRVPYG